MDDSIVERHPGYEERYGFGDGDGEVDDGQGLGGVGDLGAPECRRQKDQNRKKLQAAEKHEAG
jgi:hypothetical protein